jgi:hypothetical protein
MNCYCTLAEVKELVNLTDSSRDWDLLRVIEAVSREIEGPAGARRRFWLIIEDRYFEWTPRQENELLIDDLVELGRAKIGDVEGVDESEAVLADTKRDGLYTGQAWEIGRDFVLEPAGGWPKTALLRLDWGRYPLQEGRRMYRITGTWGYGDGLKASPWKATGVTGTVETADGLELELSADGAVKVGHTIKLGNEQMFVEGVTVVEGEGEEPDTATATVRRGVNGTIGEVQAAAAVRIAEYPMEVVRACLYFAAEAWNLNAYAGVDRETVGEHSVVMAEIKPEVRRRILASVSKGW